MIRMAEELGDFIEASGLLEYDPDAIKKIWEHGINLIDQVNDVSKNLGIFNNFPHSMNYELCI